MSTHVVIDSNASYKEIIPLKKEIRQLLKEQKIEHATIEIDFENENCENQTC